MPESEQSLPVIENGKARGKPRVLIIDDNPHYAKIFELLSEELEITPYIASGCAEALDALRQHSFDIILMDWFMPEVDGLLCTKKIRELEKTIGGVHTPIIGVSGYMSASREKSLDGGMDDFLSVPFTFEDLREKLCQWLQKEKGLTADNTNK